MRIRVLLRVLDATVQFTTVSKGERLVLKQF